MPDESTPKGGMLVTFMQNCGTITPENDLIKRIKGCNITVYKQSTGKKMSKNQSSRDHISGKSYNKYLTHTLSSSSILIRSPRLACSAAIARVFKPDYLQSLVIVHVFIISVALQPTLFVPARHKIILLHVVYVAAKTVLFPLYLWGLLSFLFQWSSYFLRRETFLLSSLSSVRQKTFFSSLVSNHLIERI